MYIVLYYYNHKLVMSEASTKKEAFEIMRGKDSAVVLKTISFV